MTQLAAGSRDARWVPAAFLLRPEPLFAALVVAGNDFWLKPRHPCLLSGKLSDFGLCFLFPLLVAAALEWTVSLALWLARSSRPIPALALYRLSTVIAAGYFTLIKLTDAGAAFHVSVLTSLFPAHRFRAVADATDLVALPLTFVAYAYLKRLSSTNPSR